MEALKVALALIALVGIVGPARAIPVLPDSYDMPNGDGQASGGSFNYWDAAYTGSGLTTVDGAPLSGGLGKLSDGVTSTDYWFNVSNNAGTGQYVGWRHGFSTNPQITFNFAGSPAIDRITIYLDNSQVGGVFAPSAILIDGISKNFIAPGVGTVGPVTFSGLGLTGGSHSIQLNQASSNWVFASEITFDGASGQIPEPGTLALIGLGLAGFVATMKRKRA